jgi:hypothetical protein
METVTVKELIEILTSLPKSRQDEPVAVFDLTTGARTHVCGIDTDCFNHTVVDFNFNGEG